MILTVHGEFEEAEPGTNQTGMRGFTRTFVLGPGAPGKSPVRVSSDLLALRAYTAVPSMLPANAAPSHATQQQTVEVTPSSTSSTGPSVEVKQQLVIELSKRSNMTLQYSERCLSEVNWTFDAAIAAFEQNKAMLPSDAFM